AGGDVSGGAQPMIGAEPLDGGDPTSGGFVSHELSPSAGAQVDDVQARLNAGEFVIPKDVAAWKGQEFFYKLMAQARKMRATAGQESGQGTGYAQGGEEGETQQMAMGGTAGYEAAAARYGGSKGAMGAMTGGMQGMPSAGQAQPAPIYDQTDQFAQTQQPMFEPAQQNPMFDQYQQSGRFNPAQLGYSGYG